MPDLDLVGAVVSKALASTPITGLTSTRVSGVRQDAWGLPAYALWVDGPKGGPDDLDPPWRRARVDLHCYGPDGRTSKLLAERALGVFVPRDGSDQGFTAAHTTVAEVDQEAAPFYLPDPETNWPRTVVPLILTFVGVPV